MVALKASETEHIRKLGTRKWNAALSAAGRTLMKNDRMTGMHKIRDLLVTKAALKGTGCPGVAPFLVPATSGRGSQAVQDVASAAFEEAVDAVTNSNWSNA